jgi:hypothetical protein
MNDDDKTPPGEKTHMFDKPQNVKRVVFALCALCAITFVLDALIHRHVDHPWEALFGFHGIYGFVTCGLLVLGAKEMRKVLMRKDDYYDD